MMKQITLTLPDGSVDRLSKLATDTEDDIGGVIAKAIQLYEGAVKIVDEGGAVFGETFDGERKELLARHEADAAQS